MRIILHALAAGTALALLGGCDLREPPPTREELAAKAAELRAEVTATAKYQALLRRRLTDSNPVRVESALLCETQHVLAEVGADHLEEALSSAEGREYTLADRPSIRAVDLTLHTKLIPMSIQLCRQLALEGYDIDTMWLAGKK